MKRTTLKLMAALFVAALSLGFTSCSDDDDSSDKKVVTLEDIGDNEYSDGLLKYSLGEDGTACVLGFADNASSKLTIPAKAKFDGKTYNVTTIGYQAFFDCDDLTSITFPNTIKEIEEDAFYDCNNLTSAVLPKSIKTIGDYAFDFCNELKNIGSLNMVEKVGEFCFYGTQLERVTIPATLAEIGEGAFSTPKLQEIVVEAGNPTYDSRGKCNAIIEKKTNTLHTACVNTVIPNDVTIIGPNAYYSVPIESIEIPSCITTIERKAFYGCTNLKSIVIPDNVTKLGEGAFYYCKSLQSVTLSKNIEAIESGTFYECINLKTVNFPEGTKVKSVNEGAFKFSGIESINLPTTLTKIGDRAFYDSSLKEITLGTTITSIGEDAFAYCDALSKVTCLRNYPAQYNADENAFGDGDTINKTLYVNAGFGCKSRYELSSPWKKFKTIKTL